MIIIGAYPRSVACNQSDQSPLCDLLGLMDELSKDIGLHILPFVEADGDYGFAPRDWFSIDPRFGSWEDVVRLSHERPVIIDGIYNHVGLGHKWCRDFLDDGICDKLHIFSFKPSCEIKSPRGGSVFRKHKVRGRNYWAWQTFSAKAIDVRLGNPKVIDKIEEHLAYLAYRGVWGVRLDGVAYYGKKLGNPQHHHPFAIKHARAIGMIARDHNLRIIPQLNSDTHGINYFPVSGGFDAPLQDFAFSAILILTLLTESTQHIVSHVQRTQCLGVSIMRAPRTHDGILLKSPFLGANDRNQLLSVLRRYKVLPRIIDGQPYEFNTSFPFICSLGTDCEGMWRRIELAAVLTASLPGWCYLYLPILYGYQPELETRIARLADPRHLNRAAMPREFLSRTRRLPGFIKLRETLDVLVSLRRECKLESSFTDDSVEGIGPHGLIVRRAGNRVVLIANFSKSKPLPLHTELEGELVIGTITDEKIDRLGYGLWVK